ncbi:RagB/SusD family nutrient uptake outer membrane protein [Phocaeicola paurosaccharolyticus]|uniref:RagB/SusD family nutrient uptake outer membrane protein n=1 Tax=Phocaeicola paurosaccharolyticus TaxID=732242 RepID=UPI00046AB0E2|nr:RagB/SusD family nutrient uptake outer membrane protein [Phocaeicola paurosaccharolyticus]
MKKILYSTLCIAALFTATSCNDYLDAESPSVVDADFVFSNDVTTRAALTGGYFDWRTVANGQVFGDGNFYALDACGSDIERHPEGYNNQLPRHIPESFYENGTAMSSYYPDSYLNYFKDDDKNAYNMLFGVVGKANAVITAMENSKNFESIEKATTPTALSQMYGEAIALKATVYRELIKYYGDVPYIDKFGETAKNLSPRDSIYDVLIAKLEKVENLMFPIGSIPGIEAANKSYFSKTYVQGLIGRLCLEAGGYQTRRDDIKPVSGAGTALTIETKGQAHDGATYGRRSDWKDLYTKAKGAYSRLLANPGRAIFHPTDPRGAKDGKGRVLGNPYQYFFQQMHDDDLAYADESIYEYPQQQGNDSDARSYAHGRPCTGSNNQYPNKAYGQARINPAYYYGMFDPNDMRRDVAVTVTGSVGAKGVEQILAFTPGAQAKGGGPSLNKWDENRQKTVWIAKQRNSGINGPYMRISEIYLGYAEVCAALGDDATAKQYLVSIRERSFPAGKANTDAFITKCGSMLDAVIEERGFEFAGEGDRRFTLIRTGMLADRIQKIKELTKSMMDGLAKDGYYRFDNGNVISSYIWTKNVDAKTQYGYRLTAQAPDNSDPVLFPGWRGQNDAWESYGLDYKTDKPLTNVAIKGLFTPVTEDDATMKGQGYTKVSWGADLLKNKTEYYDNLFKGFEPGNYDKAPIYLIALPPNTVGAGYTNGYGFGK